MPWQRACQRSSIVAMLRPNSQWWINLLFNHSELGTAATQLCVVSTQDGCCCVNDQVFAKEEACVWGAFGVEHLHGRLLPGCCYLDCSNLVGVSKAALPTLLCCGCRRARYCSVKCQRAVWIKGGHCIMCRT